jgi:NADH-quinone oxidoreductase subunit C
VIRLSSADTDTDTDTAPADDQQGEPTEVDTHRQALLDQIAALVGGDLVGSHIDPGRQLCIRVTAESWKRTHKTLRDELGFRFFEFLSAIDWLPSPYGKSEDAGVDVGQLVTRVEDPGEIETGHAGGDTRFQVFSRLARITGRTTGITVKADIPDPRDGDQPAVESIIGVFPGANWCERETHEMFGVRFGGHPYLEKLYLPSGFEGHPLRKDFPLLARHVKPWPGIVDIEPMPEDDADGEAPEEASEEGGDGS